LKHTEKYTRQCKDEERYNEFRVGFRKTQQSTVNFHFMYL